MHCTHCKYPESSVVYTRHDGDNLIRRRRECNKCGMRFTTQERLRDKPGDDRFPIHNPAKGEQQ